MLDEGSPAPHSMEPQLRKLGLTSSLVRGVPTLSAPHTICKAGETLDPNQAHLLKLFNKPMATVGRLPCETVSVISAKDSSSFYSSTSCCDRVLTYIKEDSSTFRRVWSSSILRVLSVATAFFFRFTSRQRCSMGNAYGTVR
jgi:hypothetical protein